MDRDDQHKIHKYARPGHVVENISGRINFQQQSYKLILWPYSTTCMQAGNRYTEGNSLSWGGYVL